MSLLGKPSSGSGSGITPEQLEALVSDPDLAAAEAAAYQRLSLLLHGTVVSNPANFASYTPTAAQVSSVDVKVNEVMGAVTGVGAGVSQANAAVAGVSTQVAQVGTAVSGVSTTVGQVSTAVAGVSTGVSQVNTAVSQVNSAVSALSAAAVPSGLTVLMTRTDGLAPAGYTRVSGVAVPTGLYGQQRFMLTSFGNSTTAVNASGESKAWAISMSAGASRYNDIGTGAATTIANWPGSAGNGLGVVLANDDFAYTVGGTGQAVVNCFRYTVSTNTWASIANLPASRNGALGAKLADGRLLIIGGSSSSSTGLAVYTDTVYRYDPTTNAWTTVAALPFRALGGYATRLSDGRVFCLFTNTTNDGVTSGTNRAAIYDPVANTWTNADTPPFAGPCYQDANGNIVALSLVTPGNAQTYNFAAAAGTRWSSTPYTVPTGVVVLSAPAFTRLMANGTVFPITVGFSVNTAQALFTVGALTSQAGNTFYAVKN